MLKYKLQALLSPQFESLTKQKERVETFVNNCAAQLDESKDKIRKDICTVFVSARSENYDSIASLNVVLGLMPDLTLPEGYRELIEKQIQPLAKNRRTKIQDIKQFYTDLQTATPPDAHLLNRYVLNWLMTKLDRPLLMFEPGVEIGDAIKQAGGLYLDHAPSSYRVFNRQTIYEYMVDGVKHTIISKR